MRGHWQLQTMLTNDLTTAQFLVHTYQSDIDFRVSIQSLAYLSKAPIPGRHWRAIFVLLPRERSHFCSTPQAPIVSSGIGGNFLPICDPRCLARSPSGPFLRVPRPVTSHTLLALNSIPTGDFCVHLFLCPEEGLLWNTLSATTKSRHSTTCFPRST